MTHAPDPLPPVDDWRKSAACGPDTTDLFFPVGTDARSMVDVAMAKGICRGCPVKDQCLTWAIENRQDVGVWGGLDERERQKLHGRRLSHNTPAKPPRTPATVLAAKSVTVPGDHVVWSGKQPVFINGEEYTAPQLAWFVDYGQRPDSSLTVACGHPGCIRADHRLDAAGRAALHGTRAAYLAHRRRNEAACEPCLAANRLTRQAA